jgi:hypothetical protein
MKIIKEGVLPTNEVECTTCNSILEVTQYDSRNRYDKLNPFLYRIICPFCNKAQTFVWNTVKDTE